MFGNTDLRNDVKQLTDANTILRKENAVLRGEIEMLKRASGPPPTPLDIRVTKNGAVGIFGFRRFPIALFKQEAVAIIANIRQVATFIHDNEDRLSRGQDDPRFHPPDGPRRVKGR